MGGLVYDTNTIEIVIQNFIEFIRSIEFDSWVNR